MDERKAMTDRRFEQAGWRGMIAGELQQRIADADPLTWLLDARQEVCRQRPGGQTWHVWRDEGEFFVKLQSAGHAKGLEWSPARRLRWGLRRSPTMHALRVAQAMQDRGLLVSQVRLAAVRKGFWAREELLVTEAVQGTPLNTAIANAEVHEVHRLMRLAGQELATLHAAGIAHGHALPGHLFVNPDGSRIIFIDNDENYMTRGGPAPWRWRLLNLAQLCRRFERKAGDKAVDILLDSYADTAKLTTAETTKLRTQLTRALTQAQRKFARKQSALTKPEIRASIDAT